MIGCAGCGRTTNGTTFLCCDLGWCRECYHRAHLAPHALKSAAAVAEAERGLAELALASRADDLRGVDLANLPRWKRRARSSWPTLWIFAGSVVAFVLALLGWLELAELAAAWWASR